MSEIRAYDNLKDQVWDVVDVDVTPHYADLRIGFLDEQKPVVFKQLRFGFELRKNSEVIDSQEWPPQGVKYRKTDQTFIATHRLKFTPETDYELYLWAENGGLRVEKTHAFTTPRPAQPYPSWTWNGTTWEPPVPYPEDSGDYYWDEDAGEWVEWTEDEE